MAFTLTDVLNGNLEYFIFFLGAAKIKSILILFFVQNKIKS